MKKTLLALALGLSSTAVFASDFDYSKSSTTSWDVGGSIAERCVVNAFDGGDRSTSLDLSSTEAQTTASVSLWCNSRLGTARTTYSSHFGGVMINEEGDEISYTVDISGTQSGLDLSSPQSVNQVVNHGVNATGATRSVKVAPVVNGSEYAGIYRDIITVQVSPN